MKRIRVLIADDHVVLRSGLSMLLNTQPDMQVIGEASDGYEAVRKTIELAPDVLLLDITMPGLGGVDTIRLIKAKKLQVAILVLTMHEDSSYLREALREGAQGYIIKKAAEAELASAIRTVYGGEMFVYPSLTKALVQEVIYGGEAHGHEQLSQREREVLQLVAQGYTNKQVADKLFLSVKTVESYKARVMGKLSLHSRVELVRYALQQGLLTDEKK